MNRFEARRQRANEVAVRRNAEAACAVDFIVFGDEGDHAERCVRPSYGDVPCSRVVDIYPPAPTFMEEQMQTGIEPPADELLYVGTGIGALYGVGGIEPTTELDGWTIGRPT